MSPRLSFRAGRKAYSKIKESGISPDDVKVVAGAAGGPKWLILSRLDRAVFGSWLRPRKAPLFLIGSSIAAWRFATVSQQDPEAALDRFEAAYLEQAYAVNPPPEAISRELDKVLSRLMGENGPEEYRTERISMNIPGATAIAWLNGGRPSNSAGKWPMSLWMLLRRGKYGTE